MKPKITNSHAAMQPWAERENGAEIKKSNGFNFSLFFLF